MEQFNSKIYDKYKNLKKSRLSQDEECFRNIESDIHHYQTTTEALIEEMKTENENLRSQIASLQERYSESQKLLFEESQKTKELSNEVGKLSNEVGKLQNMLLQKNDNCNTTSPISPNTSPRVRSRDTYKSSSKKKTPSAHAKTPSAHAIGSEVQHEEATIISYEQHQQDQILPDCCRGNMTCSGDASGKSRKTCAFQMLMEFLVNMKLSLQCKPEGLCVSVIHQRSGYTFTLTWIRHEDGGDGELMYQVSSLGTLERVALDWMKEDMVFSMTMCPVFFERISRVVGRS